MLVILDITTYILYIIFYFVCKYLKNFFRITKLILLNSLF
nr:MAG TPA: hypothetical protein [Caudoviricetes sp.]